VPRSRVVGTGTATDIDTVVPRGYLAGDPPLEIEGRMGDQTQVHY